MNRLQIETDARTLMAEKTAGSSYADATDVHNWINDGIKDMCTKGKVFPKVIPLTVVSGDKDYNLPWEFIEAIRIENQNGVPLDELTLDSVGRVFTISGKPLYFYFTPTIITLASWVAATAYVIWPATGVHLSTYIIPTVGNGYMYECIIGGTSHAITEPVWSTTLGTKQTDGTVTWICRELIASLQTINFHATPATIGAGGYSLTISAMDSGLYDDKVSPNFAPTLHRYLIPYVCYRWSIKNRDAQMAAALYQEYAAGVGLPAPSPQGEQGAT